MKKTFIKRLVVILLFTITSANLFSQGFYIYTKDGQRQGYASENIDSIVFYEKAAEDIKLSEEERMFVGYWINNNTSKRMHPDLYLSEDGRCLIKYQRFDNSDGWITLVTEGEWGYNKSTKRLITTVESWSFDVELFTESSWAGIYKNQNEFYNNSFKRASNLELAQFLVSESGLCDKEYILAEIDESHNEIFTFDWKYRTEWGGYSSGDGVTIMNPYNLTVLEAVFTHIDGFDGSDDNTYYIYDLQSIKIKESKNIATIDLGLSVKWADRNLGALKLSSYGYTFPWGMTTANQYCSKWSDYDWCNGVENSFTKYCTNSRYGTIDGKTVLDSDDDAATVHLGNGWRMPTYEEFAELRKNCEWKNIKYKGDSYRLVIGPNNNRILLPLNSNGITAVYWSSSLSSSNNKKAYCLYLEPGYNSLDTEERYLNYAIRPVKE